MAAEWTATGRRILVLDADMVPCLTVARSLAARGCEVHVGGHTTAPLAARSRRVSRFFQYPDPLGETDRFLDWLASHTASEAYDLVIPVTERTLVPLSRQRERFAAVPLAMPGEDSLELVLDKSKTMALAQEVGVQVPHGVLVTAIEELDDLLERLQFPLVLKPARSIGAGETGVSQLQVSYAFDASELRAGCAHALRFGAVLLQEYFAGSGVGIELIARQGEIAYAFQHRRLHEVPLTGGGSSLRVSEPVNPLLLEAARSLVEALGWNGVAMVEFKLDDASGEFRLMEINGRFWGSLPLAQASGADFPAMLLELELNDSITPVAPYREGIVCRLLSRDLYWYEAVLRNAGTPPIVRVPSRGEVVRELGLFLSPRHRFDVQNLSDPLPGLVDIGRIVTSYLSRVRTLLAERSFRRQQQQAWRDGALAGALDSARSVTLLCYGNINRSAMADLMLRPYLEKAGYRVISAGFHPVEGRPADPVMAELAEEDGLPVASFRSTTATANMLNDSDIVLVMEKSHYDRVRSLAPAAESRTYLLGAHPGGKGVEIDDPYGCSRDTYRDVYRQLAVAADALRSLVPTSRGKVA